MSCAKRYLQLLQEVEGQAIKIGRDPKEITVVAVSKGCPASAIKEVYEVGCRDFGESRLLEALDKQGELPSSVRWHLVGTLQRKKVAKAVGHFALIHSVDSLELAQKLSLVGEAEKRDTPILLQVNVSGEATKHGLSMEQWQKELDQLLSLPRLLIQGLMTMAPLTEDESLIRSTFSQLRQFRDHLRSRVAPAHDLIHLSMGMSHDYKIAIEEGATLLRIGGAIFGS